MKTRLMKQRLDYRSGYYDEPAGRAALNSLVCEVFGLDFGPWNELGLGSGDYTPFTLFDRERAVANVSASPMHLTVNGRPLMAVQIGTVCSLPGRRRNGLVRLLMERAHEHWDRCAFTYLFANESVLEFYQQFGYQPVEQHRFACPAPDWRTPTRHARRLDFSSRPELELAARLADERAPVSHVIGATRQAWLWLFHAFIAHPDRVLYVPDLEALIIGHVDGDTLRLVDVVGRQVPSLADVFPYVGSSSVRRVEFGFTPDRLAADGVETRPDPESHLFVRGDLPVPGIPFRFPATSEA